MNMNFGFCHLCWRYEQPNSRLEALRLHSVPSRFSAAHHAGAWNTKYATTRNDSRAIGLDLGACTPEETAISIAGEIIAARWGGSGVTLSAADGPVHGQHELTKGSDCGRQDDHNASG